MLYSSDFRSIRLAPAYDVLCTRIYGTTNDMSFYIADELDIRRMNRDKFVRAANEIGLGERLAMRQFDYLSMHLEECMDKAADELFDMGFKDVMSLKDAIKKVIPN